MDIVVALLPPIGVGVLFAFAIRAMVRADRNERHAAELASRRAEDNGNSGVGNHSGVDSVIVDALAHPGNGESPKSSR